MNGQCINYEGKEIPLDVHAGITKFSGNNLKYDELFASLHNTINECK